MRLFAVLLLSLFCLSCVPVWGTVSAHGRVVDTDGNLVVSIRVYAVACPHYSFEEGDLPGSIKAAAVTGKDGRFALRSLPAPESFAKYALVAFEPDTWLGWMETTGDLNTDLQWQAPEPEDGYTIIVSKPGINTGRVIDENGQPIAGVTVTLTSLYRTDSAFPSGIGAKHLGAVVKLSPAKTAIDGAYRLTGIPEGCKVSCSFSAPGFGTLKWGDSDKTE